MINQRDLERGALGLGAVGGSVSRSGGQSQRFDETTAADLAAIELVELSCDEPSMANLPRLFPRVLFFGVG